MPSTWAYIQIDKNESLPVVITNGAVSEIALEYLKILKRRGLSQSLLETTARTLSRFANFSEAKTRISNSGDEISQFMAGLLNGVATIGLRPQSYKTAKSALDTVIKFIEWTNPEIGRNSTSSYQNSFAERAQLTRRKNDDFLYHLWEGTQRKHQDSKKRPRSEYMDVPILEQRKALEAIRPAADNAADALVSTLKLQIQSLKGELQSLRTFVKQTPCQDASISQVNHREINMQALGSIALRLLDEKHLARAGLCLSESGSLISPACNDYVLIDALNLSILKSIIDINLRA